MRVISMSGRRCAAVHLQAAAKAGRRLVEAPARQRQKLVE
jgi:hypothetical protein